MAANWFAVLCLFSLSCSLIGANNASSYLSTPELVHTLPSGAEVRGVTVVGDSIFIVRRGASQLEEYDGETFELSRQQSIPGLKYPRDLASNEQTNSVYVLEDDINMINNFVHRVDLEGGTIAKWKLDFQPYGISVTASDTVLVTLVQQEKLQEFTSAGQLIREIDLNSAGINIPTHAVILSSGQFLVTDGRSKYQVYMLSETGEVVASYGDKPVGGVGELKYPSYFAVDRDGFILVCDNNNNKVLLLSPSLTYVKDLLSKDRGLEHPRKLFLDENRSLLFVAEYDSGQVSVFRVKDA